MLFAKVQAKSNNKSLLKQTKQNSLTSSKQECVKLLDAKRSQQIAILMTSQRLDSHIIRDALISFDNQLISFETLNSIYAIRPQEDELRQIQDHLKSSPTNTEELLDKPELFLLELSRIPAFEERIYCLVYQNKFHESISSIEFRLNNINTICEDLLTSEKMRKILGLILACGNAMNASNKSRGDADGFDLAILPSLKDVKSKDNTSNLLQYIAGYYVTKLDDDINKLPIPEPSDFNFVAQVSFDELEKELRKVKNELGDVKQRVETVIRVTDALPAERGVSEELKEQFKSRVDGFLKSALDECKDQDDNYERCKIKFKKLTSAFIVKPRPCDTEVTPEYFFLFGRRLVMILRMLGRESPRSWRS